MDIFTDYNNLSSKKITPFIFSLVIHIIAIIFVLMFPIFGRSHQLISALDVTLYEYSESDIYPAGNSDQSTNDIKPSKIKPSEELVDPSEAEIKRMKRRSKDRKAPTPELSGTEFPLRTDSTGGKATGSIALDTADFPFMYYLSMLKNKISGNWIPPFGSTIPGEPKRVVIQFRIEKSGKVIDASIEESSGDKALDQSALRAVIVSDPFPQLPQAYPDSSLGIHFGFRCEI